MAKKPLTPGNIQQGSSEKNPANGPGEAEPSSHSETDFKPRFSLLIPSRTTLKIELTNKPLSYRIQIEFNWKTANKEREARHGDRVAFGNI